MHGDGEESVRSEEKLCPDKTFRSYAQHRILPAVDLQLRANNIGISSKLLPTHIAQNYHWMPAANFVVFRLNEPAGQRFYSQQIEVIPTHRIAEHPLAVSLWTNARRNKTDCG